EGVIADITGWSSNLSVGYNMVLDNNDAAHVQSVGRWTGSNCALSQAAIPVAGGPANPPVIGPNSLLGPSTVMQIVITNTASGSWAWNISSAPSATLSGMPLMERAIPLRVGATTTPFVTISRYFYPQNTHNFRIEADFFDQSGNPISQPQQTGLTATAGQWTRLAATFTPPANAVWMVYYWYLSEGVTAAEKIWTTAGQIEFESTAQATPQAPQQWQPARQLIVDLRPDR